MDSTRIRRNFGTDRISNLPCDVVDHIFTCLPLRDVVRTSILSREWRYKWVTISNLVFDNKFQQKSLGNHNLESIISQILLLHKGPIVKFTIKVRDFKTCPAINTWLNFLSNNHHIEKLNLQFSYSQIHHKVPCHLFSFDNLQHLCLAYSKLKPPYAFKGFGKLVRLHLQNVQTAPGFLSMLISKCPMLEYLYVDNNIVQTVYGDLEIDAPNLKFFHFRGILSSISFKNTPLLVDISIDWYEDPAMEVFEDLPIFEPLGNESNMSKVLAELPSVETLKSYGGFLQFLAIDGVPQKVPNIVNRLNVLQLPNVCFDNVEVTSALCLIRSFPNLQRLEIRPTYSHGDTDDTTLFLEEQEEFEIPMSHLEIVKFDNFCGSEPEMEFVKIILSAANVLRKLEIESQYAGTTEQGSNILRGLAKFRRASTKAEIEFQDVVVSKSEYCGYFEISSP